MNHTYMHGPIARARQQKRARMVQKFEAVKPYAIGLILLACLLGAGHADYIAMQNGLI